MKIECKDVRDVLAAILVRLPSQDYDDLWESGLMDSMCVVHAVVALEERFGVEFGAEHLRKENFKSVEQICGLLRSLSASA